MAELSARTPRKNGFCVSSFRLPHGSLSSSYEKAPRVAIAHSPGSTLTLGFCPEVNLFGVRRVRPNRHLRALLFSAF